MTTQRAHLLFCLIAGSILNVGCAGLTGPKTSAATAPEKTSVTLEWDAAAPGTVTGYNVYYRAEGEKYDASRKFDAGDKTVATIPNLQKKTKYYFQVSAYNKAGESAPSNETSKTTP